MTEREALAVLIDTLDFLADKDKRKLIDALPQVSDEDVQSMGVFFSTYIEAEQSDLAERQAGLDELLKKLDS